MRIELTDGQAVTIHGWLKARKSLVWSDVLGNPKVDFSTLLSYGLSEQTLYQLQPDLHAWINNRKAELKDCPRMRLWEAHPVRDFKADLADIIRSVWAPEVMARMGVFYEDLLRLGLTPETMLLFNYTLVNWATVGFSRAHAQRIPARILFRLFDMTQSEVLGSLPSISRVGLDADRDEVTPGPRTSARAGA